MREGYVAEYLRISDDDEDIGDVKKESNSIANQRKVMEYFIAGHEELSKYPVKEFVDDGVSGVSFQRPGIQNLLREVKENRIACIVVKDLSRFGRNYIEVGDYIEQIFPFMGVRFIAVSDNFDSFKNPASLDVGFKNLMHDLYSRDLSRKIKSVKSLQQKEGVYSGGGVPYGYRINDKGDGKPYVPDSEAAQVVRKIFRLAADGTTTTKIADKLNDESIPIPGAYKNQMANCRYQMKNGKRSLWSASQVSIIIRNEAYLGTFVGRKLSTVKPREVKKNDKSEYIKIADHHERLIENDLFEKAQGAIIVRKRRKPYEKGENKTALMGKVKCGCCGYGMSLKQTTKRNYYYCRMGNSCGSYIQIDLELLETVILNVLKKLVEVYHEQEENKQSERVKVLTAISKAKEEKRILELKAERCKSGRLNLYHQWKEGRFTKEEYSIRKEELIRQEAKWRNELEILDNRLADTVSAQDVPHSENYLSVFGDGQKLTKDVLDGLIERIDVYCNNKVEIKWKFNL